MQKIGKAISRRNLPVRFPLWPTINIIFFLHYFKAAGWLWGVAITILSMYWVLVAWIFYTEDRIDIFKTKQP